MRDKTVVRVLVTDANNVNQDRNHENAGLDVDFRLLRGSITQCDVQLDSPKGGEWAWLLGQLDGRGCPCKERLVFCDL